VLGVVFAHLDLPRSLSSNTLDPRNIDIELIVAENLGVSVFYLSPSSNQVEIPSFWAVPNERSTIQMTCEWLMHSASADDPYL
jgi:hypothetical protein